MGVSSHTFAGADGAKLAAALDGWCVPLAVTSVDTWRASKHRPGRRCCRCCPPFRT